MTTRGGTRAAVLATLAALAAGCDSVPATAITDCNQTAVIPDAVKADILFVVDDSGSMAAIQTNLADNFAAFANALLQSPVTIDFQIGVTTTSVHRYASATSYPETFTAGTCNPLPYGTTTTYYPRGALVSVTGATGATQRVQSTTGTAPPRIIPSSSTTLVSDFTANSNVGVCGSGKEQGLEAARLALQQTAPGGANAGFLRSGSRLAVAIVSDDDDCSDPEKAGTGDEPTACTSYPVQSYVDFFNGPLGGEYRSVVIGAIVAVDTVTHDPAACAEPGGGTAEHPAYRYKAFADAFAPHALLDSVCNPSFNDTLLKLAALIAPDTVPLSGAPADWRLLAVGVDKAGGSSVSCEVVPSSAPTPTDPTRYTVYTPPQQGRPATLTFPNVAGNTCALELGDRIQIHVLCAG